VVRNTGDQPDHDQEIMMDRRLWRKRSFMTRVENAISNVNKWCRIRALRWKRYGWWRWWWTGL